MSGTNRFEEENHENETNDEETIHMHPGCNDAGDDDADLYTGKDCRIAYGVFTETGE